MHRRLVYSSPFINLFSHVFTYTSVDSWIYILYFRLQSIWLLRSSQLWPLGALKFRSCVSLTPTPPLFCLQSTFLLFATVTCSRLILYTARSSRRISHFSKEPLSLENGVRLVSNWCTFGEFDDQSSWSTASMTSLAHTLCPGGLLF